MRELLHAALPVFILTSENFIIPAKANLDKLLD
jgi:hypothetical protein